MSSSRRSFPMRSVAVVDVGCGCRSSKLSSLFSSFWRTRNPKPRHPLYSSSYTTGTNTTTTTSSSMTSAASPYGATSSSDEVVRRRNRRRRRRNASKGQDESEGGVAVVKDSSEPYIDFKESMLQMIVENEMYGWDELNGLLHSLLALNSPENHPLILCAFADIWNGVLALPDD